MQTRAPSHPVARACSLYFSRGARAAARRNFTRARIRVALVEVRLTRWRDVQANRVGSLKCVRSALNQLTAQSGSAVARGCDRPQSVILTALSHPRCSENTLINLPFAGAKRVTGVAFPFDRDCRDARWKPISRVSATMQTPDFTRIFRLSPMFPAPAFVC
jgi:hypothetical protein